MKTEEATQTIFLDIETAPGEEPHVSDFEPKANLKDPEKIRADLEEKKEKAWRSSMLDPFAGKVYVIGLAVDGTQPFYIFNEDEKQMMESFDEWLSNYSYPRIVAHFGFTFDFQWLFYKGLKYGLRNVVMAFGKHGPSRLVDTAPIMDNLAWKTYVSQDKMSQLLLGKSGKTDMDGSMVFDALMEGKGEKVRLYCLDDVATLRECYYVLDGYGLIQ
jgi:predicted PolB exonuclease-like 3'-5' exonuclease